MSMRTMIGFTVIAYLTGCDVATDAGDRPAGELSVSQELGTPICPDGSTDCTHSNGAGVYTADGGSATVDTMRFHSTLLMITTLVNTGSSVTFLGRYFDATSRQWLLLSQPGKIVGADYGGLSGFDVNAVSESVTVPTWTLRNPAVADLPIPVTGDDLVNLKLHAVFTAVGPNPTYVVLEFDNPHIVGLDDDPDNDPMHPHHPSSSPPPLHAYNMRWREEGSTASVQYCLDANAGPDSVVFQRGMYVEPVTGRVTRDASTADYITISCTLGGLAKAYLWGYSYVSTPGVDDTTFYFDATIQMKRASYCADWRHYTVTGMPIRITDDQGINQETMDRIEAWWAPSGAVCLNLGQRRRMDLQFDGSCTGRPPIPKCPALSGPLTGPLAPKSLVDSLGTLPAIAGDAGT